MGISTRNFGLALVAAALFHGLLLAQKLVFKNAPASSKVPLRVTIFKEESPEPTPEPVVEAQLRDTVSKSETPKSVPPKVDKLIIATKPEKGAEPRIVVQTSVQSPLFKNWLKSETHNVIKQNPEAVAEFDQTFEELAPYQSPKELSASNPKSFPKGSTTFMVEDNGKRTCFAKIIDLLDPSAPPSFTSKDCTAKKKFDLKLNQPNNGWADR